MLVSKRIPHACLMLRNLSADLVFVFENLAWEFATIEGGEGSEGFYFDDAGLQWNVTEGGFGGWLGEFCSFLEGG